MNLIYSIVSLLCNIFRQNNYRQHDDQKLLHTVIKSSYINHIFTLNYLDIRLAL